LLVYGGWENKEDDAVESELQQFPYSSFKPAGWWSQLLSRNDAEIESVHGPSTEQDFRPYCLYGARKVRAATTHRHTQRLSEANHRNTQRCVWRPILTTRPSTPAGHPTALASASTTSGRNQRTCYGIRLCLWSRFRDSPHLQFDSSSLRRNPIHGWARCNRLRPLARAHTVSAARRAASVVLKSSKSSRQSLTVGLRAESEYSCESSSLSICRLQRLNLKRKSRPGT